MIHIYKGYPQIPWRKASTLRTALMIVLEHEAHGCYGASLIHAGYDFANGIKNARKARSVETYLTLRRWRGLVSQGFEILYNGDILEEAYKPEDIKTAEDLERLLSCVFEGYRVKDTEEDEE